MFACNTKRTSFSLALPSHKSTSPLCCDGNTFVILLFQMSPSLCQRCGFSKVKESWSFKIPLVRWCSSYSQRRSVGVHNSSAFNIQELNSGEEWCLVWCYSTAPFVSSALRWGAFTEHATRRGVRCWIVRLLCLGKSQPQQRASQDRARLCESMRGTYTCVTAAETQPLHWLSAKECDVGSRPPTVTKTPGRGFSQRQRQETVVFHCSEALPLPCQGVHYAAEAEIRSPLKEEASSFL